MKFLVEQELVTNTVIYFIFLKIKIENFLRQLVFKFLIKIFSFLFNIVQKLVIFMSG